MTNIYNCVDIFNNIIYIIEKKYEGEILYKDKNLAKMNLDDYRSRDVGIVFQSYSLLPHLTALENIK